MTKKTIFKIPPQKKKNEEHQHSIWQQTLEQNNQQNIEHPNDKENEQEEQDQQPNNNDELYLEMCDEITSLLPSVLHEMKSHGFIEYLLIMFRLISSGDFDFSNLCFMLFCDVLRFWTTPSTTMMRYPFKTTRIFWWLGKLLFHGRFQRFLSGYKNSGYLPIKTKGWYNPLEAKINFAVPSHIHLQQHPITLKLPEINGPGMFNEILDIISKDNNNSFVLIFDGKKLAPGLT